MIKNTFIFNPVRPDYIQRCLDTLYKHTDMSESKVIVVDQTLNGLQLSKDHVHLVLRPYRNLGFAKSMNEGIIHGLRWGSKYITCANDDIEYIHNDWWNGIEKTFQQYGERVLAVNPECPRIPLWGYGRPHGEYIDILKYKTDFTDEEYQYLLKGDLKNWKEVGELHSTEVDLPKTFPLQKNGVTDAIATWHTTFKREFFSKIGLFEERYYPGGGEDYDLNARAYREDYRMLGTTKSWVWHWWGSSKDNQQLLGEGLPIIKELRWLNPNQLWNPDDNLSWNETTKQMEPKVFDPWGKVTLQDGSKKPMKRESEVGIIEI